ncbi:hypothetical protein EPH_0004630 [Eimeria praecox]|uniref:Uncharacterized protein n=1 Tax=Eimeria praecox TaxID=51316 RepID=U6G7C1_9EIME|nr:hypothetical protein EPH_0004630 [Eimeria praecox]
MTEKREHVSNAHPGVGCLMPAYSVRRLRQPLKLGLGWGYNRRLGKQRHHFGVREAADTTDEHTEMKNEPSTHGGIGLLQQPSTQFVADKGTDKPFP